MNNEGPGHARHLDQAEVGVETGVEQRSTKTKTDTQKVGKANLLTNSQEA
jgi:hypothetical protein